jgi:hypothetical protein
MWDTEVQCRDMDAINAWKRARAADDVKYGGRSIE